jgi:hypothetical protein
MLRVPICICLIAGLAVPLGAGIDRESPSILTVVLHFKGPYSRTSLEEMKRESGLILNASGVLLDWRVLGEDTPESYNDLVVMTFKGDCEYGPAPPDDNEHGPLAVTRMFEGEVQPFGEVDCYRVANMVRNAISGGDHFRGNLLMGRAMGRVVAHELVHMLTKSGQHGTEGVEKPALSGEQLIAGYLPLSVFDIDRVKQELRCRLSPCDMRE